MMTRLSWAILNTTANRIINEEDLRKKCPREFMTYKNPWTEFASNLRAFRYSSENWKWKQNTEDTPEEMREQVLCILDSFRLKHLEKYGVAGWMLSGMLEEIPNQK